MPTAAAGVMLAPMKWLKHAFAIEPATAGPTPQELEVVDRLAREIVRRRLTAPALAFLEMSRPLSYLGSQALHFLDPALSVISPGEGRQRLATFLERRDAIEILCSRIEVAEQGTTSAETTKVDATSHAGRAASGAAADPEATACDRGPSSSRQ